MRIPTTVRADQRACSRASDRCARRIGRAIAALLVCTAALGCADDREPSESADSGVRYARSTFPTGPWETESEYPKPTPDSPPMVMREVTRYAPGTEPTAEQVKAAHDFVEACHASALRHGWANYETGLAAGFERPPRDPRHYRNIEYLLDGMVLDPDRPEYLMYYPTVAGTMELVGFMFMTNNRTQWGPQIGGPLTIWHYHIWTNKQCVDRDVISLGFVEPDEECERGVGDHRSLEMMHVWLIDHPDGPFATPMDLPQDLVEAGLAKRKRERGY